MPLAKKVDERFTYQDYITWPDDERWELINGVPYDMSPAPTFRHQRIVGMFYHLLMTKLRGKACTPGISPTDIVLSENDVVQPDVFVICSQSKITEKNIQGAPDLVIEVISPSSNIKDRREKRELYERYGVKEYIIVDIIEKYVERFCLEKNGKYRASDIFKPEETIKLFSLRDLEISLSEVFEIEVVSENEEKAKTS